jgi:hypothetical protein
MTNERVANNIYKWKPYATRPKGRPRVRWEDDVRNELRKMGVTNWKQTTQDRKKWKEIIEALKCFSLQPDTTPLQPNHTVTPTHIEPEQYNTLNKSTISRKLLKMDVLTFETC